MIKFKSIISAMVAAALLAGTPTLSWGTEQGQQRKAARDVKQDSRQGARDTKQACRSANDKSNAACRQDKRQTKQTGRQTGRDIKY
ncbi:hypothetical protein [Rhizobium sp. Root1220]|uniref:hypothetical protein n=1 Tax=Rhizobium sp. Root1220 TaxID=1736432 RepID=UPI0006F3CC04|nr:hypothetical protein [Rhizobium sp. Root1220]KQV80473.1 hypothetical protein ASC90_25010 [Rhizobium sp. Root1220]